MSRQTLKRLGVGAAWVLLGASAFGLSVSPARADDEVLHRLAKFGKLGSSDARRLADGVTARMKRAADMAGANDPLRMAVSKALVGAPVPADAMSAAKVRLRLYAGLNQWALDNVFAPRAGAMAACTGQFGFSQADCQALLAAGGNVSLAEAARQGAGAPVGGMPAAGGGAQPAAGFGYAQQQPSAFGQRPAYAQQPVAYGQPRPAYGQPAAYGQPPAQYGQYPAGGYAQRPMPAQQGAWAARPAAQPAPMMQRPAPAARPMVPAGPPPPSAAVVASRKAEYEKQRQAYLDRKREEMAARKGKIIAATDGAERVQRGPTSADEAAVVGLPPEAAAKASPGVKSSTKATAAPSKAEPGKPAAVAAAAEPGAAEEPAPARPAGKTLDNDFLSGLMDDPLGKK